MGITYLKAITKIEITKLLYSKVLKTTLLFVLKPAQ